MSLWTEFSICFIQDIKYIYKGDWQGKGKGRGTEVRLFVGYAAMGFPSISEIPLWTSRKEALL